MRFRLVGLSTPSLPTSCLKDPRMGHDTIYLELFTVGMVRWIKLPRCWQLKDKKNSPLTDTKYLLKHNGVTIIHTHTHTHTLTHTYIYIYKYMEIVFFFVFERQTIEVFCWCSLSMLLNFSESKAFAEEAFVLRKIFFLFYCLQYGYRIYPPLNLKHLFYRDSPGNKYSWLGN